MATLQDFSQLRSILDDTIPRDGSIWPEYAATMLICFNGKKNGIAFGELWSFYFKEPRPFRGLDQLLFVMDQLMDEADDPMKFYETRKLPTQPGKRRKRGPISEQEVELPPRIKKRPHYGPMELKAIRGQLATIPIRVYFRRNASMQGKIRLGKNYVCFRSALELLHLLSEMLDALETVKENASTNIDKIFEETREGQREWCI